MSDIQGALKELILPPGAAPWRKSAAPTPHGYGEIKKARPRHKMIVTMHLAGFKDVEIARELGYTPARVAAILRSRHPDLVKHREEVSSKVAQHLDDLVLRFRAESSKSLDVLVEIRDATAAPFSERRLSALAILDRAGYSPVKKNVNIDSNVPFEELKSIVGRIEEANEVVERRQEWVVKNLPTGT